MLNLIKMDLYRLLRSASAWVLILCLFAVTLLNIFQTRGFSQGTKEGTQAVPVISLTIPGGGSNGNTGQEPLRSVGYTDANGILLEMLCVFVPLFLHAEKRNHFFRNISARIPSRTTLFFSRFLSLALTILSAMGLCAVLTIAGRSLLAQGQDAVLLPSRFFLLFGLQFLFHVSFLSFILFLYALSGDLLPSMLLPFLMSIGLDSVVYDALGKVLPVFSGNCALSALVHSAVPGTLLNAREAAAAAVWGVLPLIVCCALSLLLFQKRDIP